jgi:hypothetical protein
MHAVRYEKGKLDESDRSVVQFKLGGVLSLCAYCLPDNSVNSPMHVVSESYALLRMLHDWAATSFGSSCIHTHSSGAG